MYILGLGLQGIGNKICLHFKIYYFHLFFPYVSQLEFVHPVDTRWWLGSCTDSSSISTSSCISIMIGNGIHNCTSICRCFLFLFSNSMSISVRSSSSTIHVASITLSINTQSKNCMKQIIQSTMFFLTKGRKPKNLDSNRTQPKLKFPNLTV